MPRPPLPLGTWGKVRRYQVGKNSWRAMAKYRDYDGVTRQVEASGPTGAKAERRLIENLSKRGRVNGQGEIKADTRIEDIAPQWYAEIKAQGKKPTTLDAYDDAIQLHVVPGVGSLRVREITVGVADRFLTSVRDNKGPSAAKHAKTVLSGIMRLAARHDATDTNPVRDAAKIEVQKKPARALELDEVRALRAGLREDKQARARDVPILVDFMLGTGMRIGETIGVTWEALDFDKNRVTIMATVVRTKRDGLILQEEPKTEAGWRKLYLPDWLVSLLKERDSIENEWNLVFPSQQGKLRDRSNTNSDVRDALDALGFNWATPHTFRKTAATVLKKAGLDDIDISNQLGHKRISMTQDTYFGRGEASPKAAELLNRIDEGGDEKCG